MLYGESLYKDYVIDCLKYTPEIAVAFSCGKDSIVVLDIVARYFPKFKVVFQYTVEGLSFQESIISYVEKRYNTKVIRIPHFVLCELYKQGFYRPLTAVTEKLPDKTMKMRNGIDNMKAATGMDWIAYGSKVSDSITMRRFLKSKGGCQPNLKRLYPVARFSDRAVYSYLRYYKIPIPSDYRLFGRSMMWELETFKKIHDHFPEDFKKIRRVFPYIDAAVKRAEWFEARKTGQKR